MLIIRQNHKLMGPEPRSARVTDKGAVPEKTKPLGFPRGFDGGAGRDRTDDLYNAIVALSQLSYGP